MSKKLSYSPKTQTYYPVRPPLHFPAEPNLSLTSFLFQTSTSHPNSLALIDPDTNCTFTFQHLRTQVSTFSHILAHQFHILKHDVVLIFAPNSANFVVCFLSVVGIGAIVTTCNPLYTKPEVSRQVNDCKPKLVITVPELFHKVKDFNLPVILFGSLDNHDPSISKNPKTWDYFTLIQSAEPKTELPLDNVLQSDVAALFYSSGTTGTSKGVILTHGNFIATSLMVTCDQDRYKESQNVFLCFLPIFHIMGWSCLVYSQLRRGNTVVLLQKFELDNVLRCLQKYRITYMYVAPPVMVALAKQNVVKKYDLSSLQQIRCGAAPLSKDVMGDCAKVFPHVEIIQGYGMTEACGVVSMENPREESQLSGSTGTLVPGVEAKIMSVETGNSLPPNERGEIWLRGPNMMQGYLNNSKATEQTMDKQGWVHTGDIGYFNDEGQLFVLDRIKDLIKCYGFQVAPAELEGLLLSHSEILDAAVISIPDAKAGEVPIAYVVRSPTSALTEDNILEFIKNQVAPFKRLRMVIFTDGIPKAPTGKILRRELRQKIKSKI